MFKLRYECEYCGYTILSTENDLPEECPNCKEDSRNNVEIYDCTSCIHFEGNDSCALLDWAISDSFCPIKKKIK